jgi:SprT-like family.
MLHIANLSKQGIRVLPHGAVEIPGVKFKTFYTVCGLDNSDAYRVEYLRERWKYFNKNLFGSLMKEPKFSAQKNKRALGVWYARIRTIEIATRIFKQPKEFDLLGTLVHEMAHQYNSEVNHSTELDAHGESWQHIMMSIGMDTDPKYSGPALKTKQERQKEEELQRTLDSSKRVSGPGTDMVFDRVTVLRFVNPAQGIDCPMLAEPNRHESSLSRKFIIGRMVKKDGTVDERFRSIRAELTALPGPLKMRTPLYRAAQKIADALNNRPLRIT